MIKKGKKKTGQNTGGVIRPQYSTVNTSIVMQQIRLCYPCKEGHNDTNNNNKSS